MRLSIHPKICVGSIIRHSITKEFFVIYDFIYASDNDTITYYILSKEHCDKLKQMSKSIKEDNLRCKVITGDELDDYYVIHEDYCNIEKINYFYFS